MTSQLPTSCEFTPHEKWPVEIARLFEEGIKSYAATAFTASTMICRKVLMACACDKGAEDGKAFTFYVEFVTKVLAYPPAQEAIEAIRKIGNEANHGIEFVSADDAKRAMKIVTYMLDMIYSFPTA